MGNSKLLNVYRCSMYRGPVPTLIKVTLGVKKCPKNQVFNVRGDIPVLIKVMSNEKEYNLQR